MEAFAICAPASIQFVNPAAKVVHKTVEKQSIDFENYLKETNWLSVYF